MEVSRNCLADGSTLPVNRPFTPAVTPADGPCQCARKITAAGSNPARRGETTVQQDLLLNASDSAQKEAALTYILDAWEEALLDGIEPEMLANAALFAALADLIEVYGEDAVAKMADGLSRRIGHGEFTLKRTRQ